MSVENVVKCIVELVANIAKCVRFFHFLSHMRLARARQWMTRRAVSVEMTSSV
ncbi:predicted protein [Plenodomus lingam JN3]|uniref:Predicted protein n=1 Tax=Leptosphaeria maculans (strain JN3 / isolate v23.1.3 / race Av1-4-5-6-7-8) TaxID=985895 RepID=E4ZYA7_LEPMJ|nr:predicted protein [Plenodomus lingam JN3]CBX96352.1 predicted protein [Plenodomus lingam JN3]